MLDNLRTKDDLVRLKEKISRQEVAVTGKKKEEKLSQMEDELSQVKTVEIQISFEPDRAFTDKLYRKIKAFVKGLFVLDIKKQENLIGGAVILYNGRYLDYSINDI